MFPAQPPPIAQVSTPPTFTCPKDLDTTSVMQAAWRAVIFKTCENIENDNFRGIKVEHLHDFGTRGDVLGSAGLAT